MIRVLHIITDSNVGGAGMLLSTLLRYIDRREYSMSVLLPEGSRIIPYLRGYAEITEISVRPDASLHLPDYFRFKRAIARLSPDIVHTHGATLARICAKDLGCKTVMTRHCTYNAKVMNRFPLRQLNSLIYARYTDACIATSVSAMENLIDIGVPKDKITVIINAPTKPERLSPEAREDLKKRIGVSGKFIIGMVARLEKCKGHKTVIDAARMIKEQLPRSDIVFLFLGDGSLEKELKEYAKGLDNVIFCGFRSDIGDFENVFDICLNASVGTETSCLAISECMSLGVPCIASNYGGNTYMVGDSNGLLFPTGDEKALFERIVRLNSDRSLLRALSLGSAAKFARDFSPVNMARSYERVYRSVLDKKS